MCTEGLFSVYLGLVMCFFRVCLGFVWSWFSVSLNLVKCLFKAGLWFS